MLRRPITKFSSFNNISRIHKNQYSLKPTNNKFDVELIKDKFCDFKNKLNKNQQKFDIESIKHGVNICFEKYNNFTRKMNENQENNNMFSYREKVHHSVLFGLITGTAIGGFSGGLPMAVLGMTFGIFGGYFVFFAGVPMYIAFGGVVVITTISGYVIKKLFNKKK